MKDAAHEGLGEKEYNVCDFYFTLAYFITLYFIFSGIAITSR